MNARGTQPQHVSADTETPSHIQDFWPQDNQVLIRMYGQGLGDCFLLAFPRTRSTSAVPASDDARPVYVLIDCGVISGTPCAAERMTQVVHDIRLTTCDETLAKSTREPKGHLDLLIITNSHWDHISGFEEAKAEWAHIQVDEVWLPWTERRDADVLSGLLHRVTSKQQHALAQVADQARRFNLDDRLGLALSVASFLADPSDCDDGFVTAVSEAPTPSDIADKRCKKGSWISCEAGDVRRLPGTQANAYVLGPPRNWAHLRSISAGAHDQAPGSGNAKSAEGAARGGSQVPLDPIAPIRRYVEEPSSLNAVVMPLLGLPADGPAGRKTESALIDSDVYDRTFPFRRLVRMPLPVAEAAAAGSPDTYRSLASYFDEVSHWRRIDYDWLVGAESFALEVDSLINNMSLVLAIELSPAAAGKEANVLLFASDAQDGNWRSWDDIPAWKGQNGARPSQKDPDVGDLLRRTIFYKVGHHGSNTATPRDVGIERMRDDGALIAFVPATQTAAHDIKGWSNMPSDSVLEALSARTGARVVFADGSIRGCDEKGLEAARHRLGLDVSPLKLPEATDEAGNVIVPEYPLWVQVTIDV